MDHDPTEDVRRAMVIAINTLPGSREALETEHGRVYDTQELGKEFEVIGFGAPFVVVRRRSDGKRGSLMFQHRPRFYFSFEEDR